MPDSKEVFNKEMLEKAIKEIPKEDFLVSPPHLTGAVRDDTLDADSIKHRFMRSKREMIEESFRKRMESTYAEMIRKTLMGDWSEDLRVAKIKKDEMTFMTGGRNCGKSTAEEVERLIMKEKTESKILDRLRHSNYYATVKRSLVVPVMMPEDGKLRPLSCDISVGTGVKMVKLDDGVDSSLLFQIVVSPDETDLISGCFSMNLNEDVLNHLDIKEMSNFQDGIFKAKAKTDSVMHGVYLKANIRKSKVLIKEGDICLVNNINEVNDHISMTIHDCFNFEISAKSFTHIFGKAQLDDLIISQLKKVTKAKPKSNDKRRGMFA